MGRNWGMEGSRDPYRDDDDVRDPMSSRDRNEAHPDSKDEARGDAREAAGRNARDTDANPTGPEGNDKTKRDRPDTDDFQRELEERE